MTNHRDFRLLSVELIRKRKQQAYEPGSVPPPKRWRLPLIWPQSLNWVQAIYPSASGGSPLIRIAPNHRYTWSYSPWDVQPRRIATCAVSSYLAFSPSPSRRKAVILCYTLP